MIRKKWLDCDGVLANFTGAAIYHFGRLQDYSQTRRYDFYKDWGLSTQQFFLEINSRSFWSNIRPYPWARDLLEAVKPDAIVTSQPPFGSEFFDARIDWLWRHFGIERDEIIFCTGKDKINSNAVLIDDCEANIEAFRKDNGVGILFPAPWNSNRCCEWKHALQELESVG